MTASGLAAGTCIDLESALLHPRSGAGAGAGTCRLHHDDSKGIMSSCEGVLQGASNGETVDVFTHCLGVFLVFKDEAMPETIRKWNVKRFELQRNDRHRDRAIVQDVWHAVDAFLGSSVHKSSLTY